MNPATRIYVAGGTTFLGAALVAGLRERGYTQVSGDDGAVDLADRVSVDRQFEQHAPAIVVYAGGRSGGIQENIDSPAELMRDNLLAATHVIDAAYRYDASKVVYIGSSCCYPRACSQPMTESMLGSGPVEPTNAAYATAKLAGLGLCRAYHEQYGLDCLPIIPANVFGPGEDTDAASGHVIGGLMGRFHEATLQGADSITVWGTGRPVRDFLYLDDFVDAVIFCLERDAGSAPINVGSGAGVTIGELAELIRDVSGFRGAVQFDCTRPDGMPEKELDTGRMRSLGWHPRTELRAGLLATWESLTEERAFAVRAAG